MFNCDAREAFLQFPAYAHTSATPRMDVGSDLLGDSSDIGPAESAMLRSIAKLIGKINERSKTMNAENV